MARVHLIVGPVGAGTSTLAGQLGRDHGEVRLILDEWMAALFSADRTDVVLEVGLIQRRARAGFLRRLDTAGYPLTIYVVDAPRDVRRERVEQRNLARGATFAMVVPPAIFELASDLWEPPDDDERRGRDVRDLDTGC